MHASLWSEAAVKGSIVLKLVIHKLGPFHSWLLFSHYFFRRLFARLLRYVFLLLFPWFFIIICVIISFIQLKFLLDSCNESSYFMEGDLVFFEDMGMLAIELPCCFFRIRVEDKLMQKYGIDFLFLILRSQLIVDPNDGGLVTNA